MFLQFESSLQAVKKEIGKYIFWIIFLVLVGLIFGFVTAYLVELKEGLII